MNDSRYSSIVDLLVLLGRETFHLGRRTSLSAELPARLDSEWKNGDAERNVTSGLERLAESVGKAAEILRSGATLFLTADDADYAPYLPAESPLDAEEAEPAVMVLIALRTLDDAVYLSLASEKYAEHYPGLAGKVEEITRLVVDITTTDQPPAHRLVPLNELRRERLDRIPEEIRCLFPWYERFSGHHPEAIALIAEKMSGMADEHSPAAVAPMEMRLLYNVIIEDDAMFERLEQESLLWRNLPDAFSEAWAWRLLQMATIYASKRPLLEAIAQAGSLGCAIRVICAAILDGTPAMEWRLQAAFCGTGLDDDERLALLQPVEQAILDGALRDEGPNTRAVQGWSQGGGAIAHDLYSPWVEKLAKIAKKGFVPLPYALARRLYLKLLESPARPLAAAVALADSLAFAPARAATWLIRALGEVVPAGEYAFASRQFRSEQTRQGETTIRVSLGDVLPSAPLPLPLPTPGGFGLPPGIILLAEEQTSGLRASLTEVYCHWRLETVLADGRIVLSKIREGTPPFTIDIEDVGGDFSACRAIMLAISNERSALELAITATIVSSDGKSPLPGVFWVTYIREDRHG